MGRVQSLSRWDDDETRCVIFLKLEAYNLEIQNTYSVLIIDTLHIYFLDFLCDCILKFPLSKIIF
jgi:hypothetical protein